MILPLLDIDKVGLYSDAEEAVAGISVEAWARRGKVVDKSQEHFRSWVITN